MSAVLKRFLNYVKYDTASSEESSTVPSTPGQLLLAKAIAAELEGIGLEDISFDHNGYIMASLPGNTETEVPVIGFIAHMDTSPEVTGADVNPKLVENYSGEDIILNSESNMVLSPLDFPELKKYVGQTLITTDGTTLLGADNKAGIAIIITAIEYLKNHPEIKHGKIRIGFTPDEEIGAGADHFDVDKFGADFAYTIDGGPLGELEFENFNAAAAKVNIKGRNVHPGSAMGKMINSILLANEFIASLPNRETPAHTAGYEGFYHLLKIQGEVEQTELKYIIRDFDMKVFEQRKGRLLEEAAKLNKKYGEGTCEVEIKDQYYNMKSQIEPVRHVVDNALRAMEECGVEPLVKPIRGGTDGSRLSYMGLPTPNIFTGGDNFHSRYEFIPLEAMEKAVEVILKISEIYAQG